MKYYKLFFIVLTCLLTSCSKTKVGVVNTKDLFLKFRMTIQTRTSLTTFTQANERDLDKIKTQLLKLDNLLKSDSISNKKGLESEIVRLVNIYENRNQVYQDSLVNLIEREDVKIWSRIHNYSKDFANENGFDLVIKNKDELDILYFNSTIDITDDLLVYINKKYEGN